MQNIIFFQNCLKLCIYHLLFITGTVSVVKPGFHRFIIVRPRYLDIVSIYLLIDAMIESIPTRRA